MEKASSVMYSIANIFNWVMLILAVCGIVLSILGGLGIGGDLTAGFGFGGLAYFIIVLIAAIIIIAMVRKAKGKGTSKGWDVLFIVLGVLSSNIFYILGGIFGLIARR